MSQARETERGTERDREGQRGTEYYIPPPMMYKNSTRKFQKKKKLKNNKITRIKDVESI
jgi:hypothetical protein